MKVSEKFHVTVTRTRKNPFEASTGQTTQYYVSVMKDKLTGKNGVEFLIGWREIGSGTTNTSPHRGKTMVTVFLQ